MSAKLSREEEVRMIVEEAYGAFIDSIKWPHLRKKLKGRLRGMISCLIIMHEVAAEATVTELWKAV